MEGNSPFLSLVTIQVAARRKRRKPNWPLRLSVGGALILMVTALALSTIWSLSLHGHSHLFREDIISVLLSRSFDLFVATWFFVVGSSFASFLNVVAYRLPRGLPITGFSRCPYCYVDIHGEDNVPLLGWLRLRGRCRACRLPISARYPGFELLGGMIGLSMFLIECVSHYANLPFATREYPIFGMLTGQMDWFAVGITLAHLMILFFLLAAAMIRWGSQSVPAKLLITGLLVWTILILAWPMVYPIDWRPWTEPTMNAFSQRWRAIGNGSVGFLAGLILARCVDFATSIQQAKPLFARTSPLSHSNADETLSSETLSSEIRSNENVSERSRSIESSEGLAPRQDSVGWMLAMGLIGATVGWQGLMSMGIFLLLICGVVAFVQRIGVGHFRLDPMGWLWLGLLLHLATWNGTEGLTYWPGSTRPIWLYGVTMFVFGLGWIILRRLEKPRKRPLELAMNYIEPRIAENGSEVDNLNPNTGS